MINNIKFYNKFLIFFSILFCFFTNTIAQISVRFPASRSVFQRNNNNSGTIQISGQLSSDADRIEARLIALGEGQGTSTDWVTIDNSIDGLSFTGAIEGKGGWYRLDVRSVFNDLVTNSTDVQKVGIGEVFVICGQSNAQGDGRNANANGSTDDRVNTFGQNYYDQNVNQFRFFPDIMPIDQFSKINRDTNVGPLGYSPWCWGELGDLLVKKLNVPIMFYNAALSGTSTLNWVQSLNGSDTFHKFIGFRFERGMPYTALRRTLQTHINLYGMRAILWHQGEFDFDTNEQTYVDNVNKIIQESRNNFGQRIPWVIARASRLMSINYPQVISAQTRLISESNMIFGGPFTDNIQPFRPDQAHFENNGSVKGLTLLANEWDNSLNNGFFSSSIPIPGKPLTEIKYTCGNTNEVNFTIERDFTSYNWSNNSSNKSIITNGGDVSLLSRDNVGNYYYSNRLTVRDVFPRERPNIKAVESLVACVGKSVELLASESKYQVIWNNGALGAKLTVSQTSPFSATYRTSQGCLSGKSSDLVPVFVNPPQKPTTRITNGDGYVCFGNKVDIAVNNPSGFKVFWNNGQTDVNAISLTANTTNPLKVKLSSAKECDSPDSDVVPYIILNVPKVPGVFQSGPFSVKAKVEDKPDMYEWFFDNKLLLNQAKQDLLVKTNGFYTVKSVSSFKLPSNKVLECKSASSTAFTYAKNDKLFGISVFPNPVVDGTFFLATDKELKNVRVELINSLGQTGMLTTIPSLLIPAEFKFPKGRLGGKYFLKIYYEGFTRTFPLIFE